MEQPTKKQVAVARKNCDFIYIETCSGYYWTSKPDPRGKQQLLSPDASDEALGIAVVNALLCSRFLPPKEHKEFYDPHANKPVYEQWVKAMMRRFGYKTRRALFSDMDRCGIKCAERRITFEPSCHVKLEIWERRKSDGFEDVVVAADSSPGIIGAALRLAFSRCT